MNRLLQAGAAFALLAGCAATRQGPPPAPILCSDKAQCDSYWSRAQVWVVSNSYYRVQVVSDAIIQTAGPIPSDTHWAYTITRQINGDGSGEIEIHGRCGNMFGCLPDSSTVGDSLRYGVTGQ